MSKPKVAAVVAYDEEAVRLHGRHALTNFQKENYDKNVLRYAGET